MDNNKFSSLVKFKIRILSSEISVTSGASILIRPGLDGARYRSLQISKGTFGFEMTPRLLEIANVIRELYKGPDVYQALSFSEHSINGVDSPCDIVLVCQSQPTLQASFPNSTAGPLVSYTV